MGAGMALDMALLAVGTAEVMVVLPCTWEA
jgi:hypothetical protein